MGARWKVNPRTLDLSAVDPKSTYGAPGDKAQTYEHLVLLRQQLAEYQRRLFAERRRSLLVVLQALDTGGKDGTIRHVFQGVNPMGVEVTSFGLPTKIELEHDFLWRVHQRTPGAGYIGVFNRSHYEDVVTTRVRGLISPKVCTRRYALINAFEDTLTHGGTKVLKFFLHISREEQHSRLQERLDNAAKRWKFHSSDLDDRLLWDDYQHAYQVALRRTSTDTCPWFVVPADRKWYRNWAVATTLVGALGDMDPQIPDPGPFSNAEFT